MDEDKIYTQGTSSGICVCCHLELKPGHVLDMPTRFFMCPDCHDACIIEFNRMKKTFPNWLRAIANVSEQKFYANIGPVDGTLH